VKKRTIFTLLAISGIGLVNPVSAELTGAYMAGGLGVFGSYSLELEQSFSDETNIHKWGISDWLHKADLVVGYGRETTITGYTSRYYIGAEITYSNSFIDEVLSRETDDTATLEVGDGYAVSARGGYFYAPTTMAYLKFSYMLRDYDITFSAEDFVASEEARFRGFGVGFGLEHHFSETPLALRFETMRVEFGSESLDLFGDPTLEPDFQPTEITGDLHLVYRF